MSLAVQVEAPETKKFRSSLPTQVVVEKPTFTYQNNGSPLDDAANGGQSPAGPSSARSSSTTSYVKDEREELCVSGNNSSNNLLYQRNGQSFVDALSTAMIFQATNAYIKQMQPTSHKGRGKSATPSVPPGPPIPGAIAAASSPAAALFGEDDWSWHRNPAAAIRSGGTNKQTPVWKFFVYNKAENLSRCIVGNCTYVLKGPHTSTLACHLKKHPPQYAEYQKLKAVYSRDRLSNISSNNSSQMSPSPAPVSSASGITSVMNTVVNNRTKIHGNGCVNIVSNSMLKSNIHDEFSSGSAVTFSKSYVSSISSPGKQSNHSVSNILDVLNARASVAALASGNGHLLQNPVAAIFNDQELDRNCSNVNNVSNNTHNASNPLQSIKNNGSNLSDLLTANLLMAASSNATASNNSIVTSGSSRRWSRDDRKQKEMELKLALMLSASQIPVNIIENSFFREFMEYVQPRFSMPRDVNYIEDIINNEHSRTVISLKSQLNAAKKVAIMMDVLKLSAPTSSAALSASADDKEDSKDSTSVHSDSGFEISEENHSGIESPKSSSALRAEEVRALMRLCVSVAFYNPLTQRTEVALLGVRPLVDHLNIVDAVKITLDQVLSDFDIPSNKVSRYICNDICELVGSNIPAEAVFPRMLEPYNQKLMQSLLNVIDTNEGIGDLKKCFYSMILNFLTRPNAMQMLQQAAGRVVSIPIADSFLVLIDAIIELKEAFLCVCAQLSLEYPIETITQSQWQTLEDVSRLLKLFHTHMNVVQDGVYATIDGVVPSLMQLQDFGTLGDLADELRKDLRRRTASVLDINHANFDGTFIQATALNPHLALLLDDEQLAFAKSAIERQLNERMRLAEELVARRTAKLSGGVDALLATVVDRAAAAAAATSSYVGNSSVMNNCNAVKNGKNCGSVISSACDSLPCQNVTASTSLYPDLIHAANERRKMMKEKQQEAAKNRYVEAVVQSYFDELAAGTNQTSPSPLTATTVPLPVTINSRNLAPLQYWQFNAVKYGLLADIATELLTIPSSTVSLERIFATSSPDLSSVNSMNIFGAGCVNFDPMILIKSIDEPVRMERDAMLRFNRALFLRF